MKPLIKFTGPGRIARWGKNDYPCVGEWSEDRIPVLCLSGWHVPDPNDIANYIDEEAWLVEVDGASESDESKSTHQRIKFLRQLTNWDHDMMALFIQNCASYARGYLTSDEWATSEEWADEAMGEYPVSSRAYAAGARAVAVAADSGPKAERAERRRQSRWLTRRLMS